MGLNLVGSEGFLAYFSKVSYTYFFKLETDSAVSRKHRESFYIRTLKPELNAERAGNLYLLRRYVVTLYNVAIFQTS